MRVLMISPHPDDIEISCGGLVAQLTREGHVVELVMVTGEGDLTMQHSKVTVTWEERKKEQEQAAEVLGISKVHWLNFAPASKFDTQPISKLVTALDAVLAEGWDEAYIPLPSHAEDHNVVWKACLAALRPTKADSLNVYAYEQPTQFHGEQLGFAINCTRYVELTEQDMAIKLEALGKHGSQVSTRANTLVGLGGVIKLAEMRGMQIGVRYAEAFLPLKIVQKVKE